MAKLKTPLIIGTVRVRSLDDLRGNFEPEDVLKSYDSRKLHQ